MLSGQEILQLKLMSYKNKGKTYIRAYRNKWVPATPEEVEKGSKGRSIPDVQIQVGVLQPDGRVKMGKKFLTLHPASTPQNGTVFLSKRYGLRRSHLLAPLHRLSWLHLTSGGGISQWRP